MQQFASSEWSMSSVDLKLLWNHRWEPHNNTLISRLSGHVPALTKLPWPGVCLLRNNQLSFWKGSTWSSRPYSQTPLGSSLRDCGGQFNANDAIIRLAVPRVEPSTFRTPVEAISRGNWGTPKLSLVQLLPNWRASLTGWNRFRKFTLSSDHRGVGPSSLMSSSLQQTLTKERFYMLLSKFN